MRLNLVFSLFEPIKPYQGSPSLCKKHNGYWRCLQIGVGICCYKWLKIVLGWASVRFQLGTFIMMWENSSALIGISFLQTFDSKLICYLSTFPENSLFSQLQPKSPIFLFKVATYSTTWTGKNDTCIGNVQLLFECCVLTCCICS